MTLKWSESYQHNLADEMEKAQKASIDRQDAKGHFDSEHEHGGQEEAEIPWEGAARGAGAEEQV